MKFFYVFKSLLKKRAQSTLLITLAFILGLVSSTAFVQANSSPLVHLSKAVPILMDLNTQPEKVITSLEEAKFVEQITPFLNKEIRVLNRKRVRLVRDAEKYLKNKPTTPAPVSETETETETETDSSLEETSGTTQETNDEQENDQEIDPSDEFLEPTTPTVLDQARKSDAVLTINTLDQAKPAHITQTGALNRAVDSIKFRLETTRSVVLEQLVLYGKVEGKKATLEDLLQKVQLEVDGVVLGSTSEIKANKILISKLKAPFNQESNYTVIVKAFPKNISLESPLLGAQFSLELGEDTFQYSSGTRIKDRASKIVDQEIRSFMGPSFSLNKSVPFFIDKSIQGDPLQQGPNELLRFQVGKNGEGFTRIGSAYEGTRVLLEIKKSKEVSIENCSLTLQSGPKIAETDKMYKTSDYDTFVNTVEATKSESVFVLFKSTDFSDKVIEGEDDIYTLTCNIGAFPAFGASVQAIVSDAPGSLIISDNNTELMGKEKSFEGLPLLGPELRPR